MNVWNETQLVRSLLWS